MQIESNLGFFKELACLNNISALWKLVDDVIFQRKHTLDQSAEQLLLSASDIVVYGAGYFAQSVLSTWKDRALPIRYLVDSDPKKQGENWYNYSVFSPKTLAEDQAKPLVGRSRFAENPAASPVVNSHLGPCVSGGFSKTLR